VLPAAPLGFYGQPLAQLLNEMQLGSAPQAVDTGLLQAPDMASALLMHVAHAELADIPAQKLLPHSLAQVPGDVQTQLPTAWMNVFAPAM